MAKRIIETSSLLSEKTLKNGKKKFKTYAIYIEQASYLLLSDKYRVYAKEDNTIIIDKKNIKTHKEAREVFQKVRETVLKKIK